VDTNSHTTAEQDIADIDLKDPELQKAASKIQATFRKRTAVSPKKEATAVTSPKLQVTAENRKQKE
jgi:hypothetical protein